MIVIQAIQLSKRFEAKPALESVSLSVESGEIVAVVGANGAGKSTLLRLLAGLLLPTSGGVRVDGVDPARASGKWRSCIGYATGERPGFYDRLTGRQNLEFFAALYGLYGVAARWRIQEVFELAAVLFPDKPYQELSTGMKQRLLLARTLLHDPQILLLDEPTRSLDTAEVQRFHQLMKRLKEKGRTIIFTTHHRQDVEAIADRLILLDGGRVQPESASPQMAAV